MGDININLLRLWYRKTGAGNGSIIGILIRAKGSVVVKDKSVEIGCSLTYAFCNYVVISFIYDLIMFFIKNRT